MSFKGWMTRVQWGKGALEERSLNDLSPIQVVRVFSREPMEQIQDTSHGVNIQEGMIELMVGSKLNC